MIDSLEKRKKILICLAMIVLVLFVYWPVQHFDFIDFDDNMYVIENTHLQAGLSTKTLVWAFTTFYITNWHPVTWLSFFLDYELYRLNPSGYHWTNVIIHIANSLLIFFFLNMVTAKLYRSAFVALLFAVHPLNIESVAWVAERKNVLSTFFWMITMLSYAWYVQHPGLKRYVIVVLFFILGLMTKPMLVTLPFVLLLLDYWPLNRYPSRPVTAGGIVLRWRHLVPFFYEKIPLLILSCVSCFITLDAAKAGHALKNIETFPLDIRIANACVSYVMYLIKMVWPQNLAVFYPHDGAVILWKVIFSCVFIVGLSVFVFFASHRYRYLTVGWLWYLVTLLPVIGLIQVGYQSMADRYAYVPLIGIFIMISWGAADIFLKIHLKKILVILSACALVFCFTIISCRQVEHWQSSESIYRHALNTTTKNFMAYNGMGNIFLSRGDYEKALLNFKKALHLRPDHVGAKCNLGLVLMLTGKDEESLKEFREALKLRPDHTNTRNTLGVLFAKQGKLNAAIAQFQEVLRIDPGNMRAKNNLLIAKQSQILSQGTHPTNRGVNLEIR